MARPGRAVAARPSARTRVPEPDQSDAPGVRATVGVSLEVPESARRIVPPRPGRHQHQPGPDPLKRTQKGRCGPGRAEGERPVKMIR